MAEFNRGLSSILILVGLGAIVIVLAVLAVANLNNKIPAQPVKPPESSTYSSSPASQQLKTFQSKLMKFSIVTPKEFDSIENLGRVTISAAKGKLYVDRNATNFDNLDDYLEDLNNRNKIETIGEEKKTIDKYYAVSRSIRFGTGEIQKEIVIFTEGWIYNFFTNEESLYSTLDQIAQSFRYIP